MIYCPQLTQQRQKVGSEGGNSLPAKQRCAKESPGQSRLERSQATPGPEPAWGSRQPAAASPACGHLLAHVGAHSSRCAWPTTTAAWPPRSSANNCCRFGSIPLPRERQILLWAPRAPAQAGEVLQSHPKLLAFSFCHVSVSVGQKQSFRY